MFPVPRFSSAASSPGLISPQTRVPDPGRVILSGGKSAYAAAEDMKDENFARNVNRFFARATVVEKLEPAAFDDGICKVAVFAENASETLTYPALRHFSARAN